MSRTGSPSVRTTVPPEVAAMLELDNGDYLVWEVEPKGDAFVISVRKGIS